MNTLLDNPRYRSAKLAVLTLAAFGLGTAAAHAGSTGTEFQDAYELLTGWVNGFLGRALAIAFLLVGLFMGIARQNLLACGVAIAAAFGLLITPTVLDNILSATISSDTISVVQVFEAEVDA